MTEKKGQLNPIRMILFIAIVALLIVGVLLFTLYKTGRIKPATTTSQEPVIESIDCESNQTCFLHRARYCGQAQGTAEIAGVEVKNEILPNCTFRKTVVSVPETEPVEFKRLLEGKSMTCQYMKYIFDPRLAYNLSVGLEQCEGSLKDAIAAYLLARNQSLP